MSFLTEATTRRMAALSRTAARSTLTAPRAAFSTSMQMRKTPTETVKDGLKTVDRAVSDKLVDGINAGTAAKDKVVDAAQNVTASDAKGKAAELQGQAKGKAAELKGAAQETAGQAKGKAQEVAGEAKGQAKEL